MEALFSHIFNSAMLSDFRSYIFFTEPLIGNELDSWKQRLCLMQLVCNHGEPGTYLCMVFQRDCLGKIYLQICLQPVIILMK